MLLIGLFFCAVCFLSSLCVLCPMSGMSLDCPFLISHSIFFDVYLIYSVLICILLDIYNKICYYGSKNITYYELFINRISFIRSLEYF